tara:strand:- start:131 stop:580 length:450 start_codon:yes stop_codon:yes gene_type:complete
MLFGFDTFARVPFAAIDDHNNVTVNTGTNDLTIAIGPLAISSGSVIEQVAGDPLTLKIGSITITTSANLTADAMPLTLNVGTYVPSGGALVNATLNRLTLASNLVTTTGGATVNPDPLALTCIVNDLGIITWNPVDPEPNNVWVPIKPY